MIKLADLTENPKNSRAISDEPVGNAAEMREALENIAGYAETARCHTEEAHVLGYLEQIEKWANAALSAPARNCDVGTAEEQTRRMAAEYCAVQKSCYESPSGRQCPLYKEGVDCRLIWAQMPYKEGGVK